MSIIEYGDILFGTFLIIFGIIKILLGSLSFILTKKQKEKIKIIRDDPTFAGLVFELVLTLFGVYSLLHGLSILHIIPEPFCTFINSTKVIYAVYAIFGIILIAFFSLVCFTNLPISKTPTDVLTYEICGLGGGLMFFITIFVYMLYFTLVDNNWVLTFNKRVLTLLGLLVLTTGLFIFFVLDALKRKTVDHKLSEIKRADLITLAMIPLGASG